MACGNNIEQELSVYTNKQSALWKDMCLDFLLTTRYGGNSINPYDTLNLAYHVGDNSADVTRNRMEILKQYFSNKTLLYANQIHSNHIATIHYNAQQNNIETKIYAYIQSNNMSTHIDTRYISNTHTNTLSSYNEICIGDVDGVICNDSRFVSLMMVADCNPILLFCPKKKVYAILHAGRLGTLSYINTHAIKILNEHYGSFSNDLYVFIGASIRQCCYEVSEHIAHEVQQNFNTQAIVQYYNHSKYSLHLNMIMLLQDELYKAGIKKEHIEVSPFCSCCNNSYFSYRRDGNTGRFGLFASIP